MIRHNNAVYKSMSREFLWSEIQDARNRNIKFIIFLTHKKIIERGLRAIIYHSSSAIADEYGAIYLKTQWNPTICWTAVTALKLTVGSVWGIKFTNSNCPL